MFKLTNCKREVYKFFYVVSECGVYKSYIRYTICNPYNTLVLCVRIKSTSKISD